MSSSSNKLVFVLVMILAIDLVFLLAQHSINDLNPGGVTVFDYGNSMIKDFDHGNQTINRSKAGFSLPEAEDSISEEGGTFADLFKTGRSWFLDVTGLTYLLNFLSAPVVFLALLGLPSLVVFGVGAFWWGTTLFILIAFLLGR